MKKSTMFVAGSVVSLALAIAAPAYAQDAQNADAVPAEETEVEEEDVILVTGSRIRLPNFESSEPTTTLDQQYIQDRGLTNIADALNELPLFRGSVTPNGAQGAFGQGVNFVNSFGLGSNRTLTLLNGRRVVSSNTPAVFGQAGGGTQVDLNVIPSILIERTDVVSIGGAPTYGSDAISGVVNLIINPRLEGGRIQATSGLTEEGDNFRYNISGAYGFNFADDRGNISFGFSYDDVDGVLQRERDFILQDVAGVQNTPIAGGGTPPNDGRVNPNIGFNVTPTDGFPGTIQAFNVRIPSLTRGGRIAGQNLQFDSSGNIVPFVNGFTFPGIFASGGDGFRFSDFGQITSDLRRFSVLAFANFEVTDGLNLFAEGLYYDARADELVQQPTFNSTLFGGASAALNFDRSNPFLNAQAVTALTNAGINNFTLSRVNGDLADLTGFNETELYRGVLGAQGDFTVFGDREFNWEVSGNYGRTSGTDFRQDINRQNFVNAVNVGRNAAGQIVCTTTPSRLATPGFAPVADPACVPLNLFGEGVASQAARDYVISESTSLTVIEQWVINANIGGSLFDLPGGALAFNLGYEHRNESARFVPSDFELNGLGRGAAVTPVSGSYNLDEVFGEVFLPVISNETDFLIDTLSIFARGRYVDNTINGGFFAWTAGGEFAIVPDVKFRGNFTRSFRAPAVTELFRPQSNAFSFVPDLCSVANRNAGPVPTVRAANCAAFLAVFPNATPLVAANASVPSRGGGNPDLENERANSFTYGVVIQPTFINGLDISVDYISIDISDPIADLTVAQITGGCFDNTVFDTSDPANGNAFCSFIRRDASGQVIADPANPGVTFGIINGNQVLYNGIQGVANYRTRLDGIGIPGSIRVGGDLTYVRRRIVDNTGVAPARTDGTVGDPEFAAQLRFGYDGESNSNKYGFSTIVNYVGEQLTSRFNRGPSPNDTREFDQFDDFATVNFNTYLETSDKFRINLSVTNLFNRQGQEYFGTLVQRNDDLGRRYTVTVSKSF